MINYFFYHFSWTIFSMFRIRIIHYFWFLLVDIELQKCNSKIIFHQLTQACLFQLFHDMNYMNTSLWGMHYFSDDGSPKSYTYTRFFRWRKSLPPCFDIDIFSRRETSESFVHILWISWVSRGKILQTSCNNNFHVEVFFETEIIYSF